ncbi:MAG: acyltransferase [Candidatus Hydrogenedentota bacterium]
MNTIIPKNSYIISGLKAVIRLIAAHCPIPWVRMLLYRLSGISIGKNAFINMNVVFEDEYISNTIIIGDRTAIAKNAALIASSHANNSRLADYPTSKFKKIIVGNDVWIGVGVVVLPGVTIGKFSIIGANAVVTKDVEPYSIVTGIPGTKTGDVRDKFKVFVDE